MKFKTGKLYRMLHSCVAECLYKDSNGDWWSNICGMGYDDVFLYLGFYVPKLSTLGKMDVKKHHVLFGDKVLIAVLDPSAWTNPPPVMAEEVKS